MSSFEQVVSEIAVACKPGALIVDVGSVKVVPSEIMLRRFPNYVDIVATHPLFGPQSAMEGIEGLKIAVCPIQGKRHARLAAFLRVALRLTVSASAIPYAARLDAAAKFQGMRSSMRLLG